MEKNTPLSLDYGILKDHVDLVVHTEYRSLHSGIGMVISFARMQSSLFCVGQPYRACENRIIRMLRGHARISINLMEYEICAQTLIITPPNSLIELLELSPDYDFQAIVTENGFLPSISIGNSTDVYAAQGVVMVLNADEWKRSEIFFSLLWDTMHCLPFRSEVARHLTLGFLYDVKSIQRQRQMASSTPFSHQDEVLRRFITLVNEHSRRERTLSFYADKLCLTPRYLGTLIRETSGQTVMQWVNQAVVLEAKVLLRHSTLPICQIAEELNFPNPSFFSKFFKRMTGMTPADYRSI